MSLNSPKGSSPTIRTAAYHSPIQLVGRSHAFTEVLRHVGRVSETNEPVLLTGEPGTGKELIASAIHHRSGRGDKPFVVANCRELPGELIEGELFRLWEDADGGTVFLDEITEASASLQENLLHALGSNQTVDLRVIAATDRKVEQEVAAGKFRSDLFYRLNATSIALPPLRERTEDIALLAQSFVDGVYSFNPAVKFSVEALTALERYSWPGNIRELENAIVRAVAMCDGTIRVRDLPQRVRNYTQKQTTGNGDSVAPDGHAREDWVPLSEVEGRYVAQVLEHTRGNKQAAARVLAVDRKTLDRMIKRHHIDSEKLRRAGR
jgi:two-component system, NtrC family, response regulator AtoC